MTRTRQTIYIKVVAEEITIVERSLAYTPLNISAGLYSAKLHLGTL